MVWVAVEDGVTKVVPLPLPVEHRSREFADSDLHQMPLAGRPGGRPVLPPDRIRSPAHETTESPEGDAHHQNHMVLRTRQVPKENVHQGHDARDDSDVEPPHHPLPNAQMNVLCFLHAYETQPNVPWILLSRC